MMSRRQIRSILATLLLLLTSLPLLGAENSVSMADWFDGLFASDAPTMSESEFDSLVCIGSATSIGAIITVVGGTAIVFGGNVGAATGTAIALPVLISSMWAACSLSKAVAPGVIWLQHRSKVLVEKLSTRVNPS
jgi:hypothetical protein